MKPRSRAILAGLVWGAIQAPILAYAVKTGILFAQSSGPNVVLAEMLLLGLVSVAGLLTGYIIGEAEGAAQAFLASQLLAGLVFWATMLTFYQPSILGLIGIQLLLFLFALAGAIPGGFLREWMQSLSVLSMDWRLPAGALALVGPTYALSLLTVSNPQALLGSWTLSLAIMIIFVAAAVLLSALGLYRSRFLRPDLGGILVMGSLIVALLSLVLLDYANFFYADCVFPVRSGLAPCAQVQELTSELWILVGTLLIPAMVLFGFAFPKYWSPAMEKTGPL